MTTEDRLERKLHKTKIALMRNPKFVLWSGVMMVGKTQLVDGIPTACTNGRDELYGREFVKVLPEKELAFVVLHENMHKMFRHLTTWKKLWDENPQLSNMACDHVINLLLVDLDPKEEFIAFPKKPDGTRMGCYDPRFRNMNTKQIFDLLKQEEESGGGGGEGMDHHDWEGAQGMGGDEQRALEKELEHAIRQGKAQHQKLNGKGGGGLDRLLEDITAPKVDWRDLLREFVKSVCSAKDVSSWRRVNRRFLSHDVYMPSLVGETIGDVVLGVDTSGSIDGVQLAAFMSEAKSIFEDVRPSNVHLIYWDAEVARHETYGQNALDSILTSTKPKGGGGTSPSCVSAYLKAKNLKPECVIMLTDGYVGSDWGSEWVAPVLWCVFNNAAATAQNGKTIHVNAD